LIRTALKNALRSHPIGRWTYTKIRGGYRDLRYARVNGRAVLNRYAHDIPRPIKIELTNICNADCIFCGYQYETRAKGTMSSELFERVLQEYRAMGGNSISFTPVVGEPLVDPAFVDRVARAREVGFGQVTTYTNGVLLENHDLPRLLSLGVEALHISMASFDETEYERIFRNKHYDKLMRGLRALLELNGQQTRPVPIRLELRSALPFDQIL
jgi:MoaA/NifB/PqqE/SkfB family radical SAM enzyme|tara:strand:- start:3394 stop:4032 length:639 start_codon:yes stop_codon:yes gene_type:complete